jgi:hypothetical protein
LSEINADLMRTVVSPNGDEYHVRVAGERLSDGIWVAWLEFIPLDESLDVLLTKTETTQPTQTDIVRWSETLTNVYIQGAFARAVNAGNGQSVRVGDPEVAAGEASLDPFEVLRRGRAALRARLRVRTRSQLLAIIDRCDLNPANKDLSQLSDVQLVTFIITAAEVQTRQRKD